MISTYRMYETERRGRLLSPLYLSKPALKSQRRQTTLTQELGSHKATGTMDIALRSLERPLPIPFNQGQIFQFRRVALNKVVCELRRIRFQKISPPNLFRVL